MERFLEHIPGLLIDGLFEAMPGDGQRDFQAASGRIQAGDGAGAAELVLAGTLRVLQRFYACLAGGDGSELSPHGWDALVASLAALKEPPPPELLARLSHIGRDFPMPGGDGGRALDETEIQYLIVACVDLCERMLSHPRYAPPTPN